MFADREKNRVDGKPTTSVTAHRSLQVPLAAFCQTESKRMAGLVRAAEH